MASGVKCSDNVLIYNNKIKLHKHTDDPKERPRIILFEINDGIIDVKKVCIEKDLEMEVDKFKYFKDLLEEDKCCYALYDCHFGTKVTQAKSELVFVLWSPDSAVVKDKMLYASSHENIKKVLAAKHKMEIHDKCDLMEKDFVLRLAKDAISLECKCLDD